jgi:hypothetical protein
MTRRHLVTVWNPLYARDGMDAHLHILLEAVRALRAGQLAVGAEDDVYVWWGKVRSPNRQQPLDHLPDILALDADLAERGEEAETHLYLTDYRSLYVAHVGEITVDDPRDDPDERDRVPGYYATQRLDCDCWFRLWDIRRLVVDDTPSVVEELHKLRNVRYHDRPVSIYGGMVELPLVVTEPDQVRWFDPAVREGLTGGRFWVEFDAERVGIGRLERELRENLFGDEVWKAFDPATRSFLAAGEKIWRDHADDPAFDFAPVIVEFTKALELSCNRIVREAMRGAPPDVRTATIDGVSVDVTAGPPLSTAQLGRYLGGSKAVADWCVKKLRDGAWLAAQLPPVLLAIAQLRNPGAHAAQLDRDAVGHWRRRLMGIGCEGEFVRLAKVRLLTP